MGFLEPRSVDQKFSPLSQTKFSLKTLVGSCKGKAQHDGKYINTIPLDFKYGSLVKDVCISRQK
jgi:hypothetical protein